MREIISNQFPFLSDEDLDQLLKMGKHIKFKNKEFIHSLSGDTIPLYFILKGMVRGYFIEKNGDERTLFIRPTRTFFTSPELLKKEKESKFTFEAVSDTELLEFSFTQFEALTNSQLPFARLYIEALKENTLTLIGRVEMLAGRTPEERYDTLIKSRPAFFENVSLKHIANYLGITPNSLSRIIKRKKKN